MEIDDRWQTAYGDLEFDKAKFPDAAGMVRQLHAMGFKVTVWVMPFVEENSAAYRLDSFLHTSWPITPALMPYFGPPVDVSRIRPGWLSSKALWRAGRGLPRATS
jgi:hypothetical protein